MIYLLIKHQQQQKRIYCQTVFGSYQYTDRNKPVEITATNTPRIEVGMGSRSVNIAFIYIYELRGVELKSFDTGLFNVGYHVD